MVVGLILDIKPLILVLLAVEAKRVGPKSFSQAKQGDLCKSGDPESPVTMGKLIPWRQLRVSK